MKTIVAPVELSESSRHVVDAAVGMAAAFGAKLWLLHVAAPEPDFVGYRAGPQEVRDGVADALHEERHALSKLAERAAAAGVDVEPLMVQGPTVQTIVEKADHLGADLIIVGSHGHGAVLRALVGSVSEGVLHKAGLPVLIVPAPRD